MSSLHQSILKTMQENKKNSQPFLLPKRCCPPHEEDNMYIFSQISYNNISRSSVTRTQTKAAVLVNNDSLTINYGVKQRQFTKPTSESQR